MTEHLIAFNDDWVPNLTCRTKRLPASGQARSPSPAVGPRRSDGSGTRLSFGRPVASRDHTHDCASCRYYASPSADQPDPDARLPAFPSLSGDVPRDTAEFSLPVPFG